MRTRRQKYRKELDRAILRWRSVIAEYPNDPGAKINLRGLELHRRRTFGVRKPRRLRNLSRPPNFPKWAVALMDVFEELDRNATEPCAEWLADKSWNSD